VVTPLTVLLILLLISLELFPVPFSPSLLLVTPFYSVPSSRYIFESGEAWN
jgi:hypothetical protein